MDSIIQKAIKNGQKSLSEFDSKQIIKEAGIPITREYLVTSKEEAIDKAKTLGYPVVLKGCSDKAAHKTELGVVKLDLIDEGEVSEAYDEISACAIELDGVLVQEMIKGDRQFVIGLSQDPQFGPCVMFGVGGIFTEVIHDVSFRIAPIDDIDAEEMLDEIRMKELLGEFRGSPPVERDTIKKALVNVSKLAIEQEEIAEIDINPIIISGNQPVVVDALVILKT